MKKKIKIIIDSDISNEVDDDFALAYVLSRKDIFDVKLISVSPFSENYKRVSIHDNTIDSKYEAMRLMRLINQKNTEIVKTGSLDFVSNGYQETSPAVEEIIKLSKKEKITIISIGTLTNVAIAIQKEPSIIKNINVVFLGTQNLLHEKFTDSNYCKDMKAFEIAIKSIENFTVIPSTVAKQFVTSIYETKSHLCVNKLGRYLHKIISNSVFKIQNRGIQTIHDIAPIAYLINKNWFCQTKLDVNELLKEQEKLNPTHQITYIYDLQKQANYEIWKDFIASVTSVEDKGKTKIFFTSDTHFSSERKIKLKQTPFESVEQMNYEQVKRWNSVVRKNDIVYHLGDFGDYDFVKKLNGKVILILGNYEENEIKQNKTTFKQFKDKLINLGFYDVIQNGKKLNIKDLKTPLYLTHKPTNCKKGMINLFGHVHTLKPVNENGFNVCVNYYDFTPVSLETIKSNIKFAKNFADKDVFA